uniref:Ig-like domain-containing protein n=1 Tax=Acanthochromis polyacanthus TaxID=80966 RepID=A0A3Q1GS89_9TELE
MSSSCCCLVSLKLYILTALCCFFSLSDKEYITAVVGQDVILPCKVPNNNKPITAVEWSRSELDPEFVLLYRDERFDVDNQHPSYKNRVDLQDKEMKDGDFSLVLKDVTKNDTGRYECHVSQGEITSKTIYLDVFSPGEFVLRVQFMFVVYKDADDETLEKTADLTDVQTPDISEISDTLVCREQS